mgnify:FL=1
MEQSFCTIAFGIKSTRINNCSKKLRTSQEKAVNGSSKRSSIERLWFNFTQTG